MGESKTSDALIVLLTIAVITLAVLFMVHCGK